MVCSEEVINVLTSKQRAHLRKLANPTDAILQVGKQGTAPELCAALDEALEARELVKISVLNNCAELPKDIAETLAQRTRSECVQVIGKKIIFYRRSRTKPMIELPR